MGMPLLAAIAALAALSEVHATPPLLASPALTRQLQQRVTLTWDDQEIGAALQRLAEVQRLPLWIDRRIDRHVRASLVGNNLTLAELMDRVTASGASDWGWATLRTVVYVGPRESALELATLSELARQAIETAPSGMRRAWLTPRAWEFPRLSEPGTLFAAVADDAGSKLREGPSLPHDLWPASAIPAISPIDRAVLILSGFDLQLSASRDGRQVGAVRIERPVQITATHPASAQLQASVDALAAADSTLRTRRQGGRLSVSGRWEDHELLRRAINPGATPNREANVGVPPRVNEQRFTLRIANKPVGAVLHQLGAQLQLDVVWDAALAAAAREMLVSCEVREADLDGLLEAVLTPAGLVFERAGTTVTIRAANSNSAPGSAGG